MPSEPEPPNQESPSKAAAAEYIAVQMSRLARMANANEFALLAYLIDMAVLEAWREASEPRGGPGEAGPAQGGNGPADGAPRRPKAQRNDTRWPG
jgi:hypothetical protein